MVGKILFTWSGGKDSILALYELQKTSSYEIFAFLTTVTADYDRVSMHGVRRALLEQQAAALGFPLEIVLISKHASNEDYESQMREVLTNYLTAGITSVAFGDIFLADVREYRETNLSKLGMKGIFPLWKRDTAELAHTFIKLGFKAITTCVDSRTLDKTFVGRVIDDQFLADLPSTADPCGENGEYHSFVFDGPLFENPVKFEKGQIILREKRFYFCDLIPAD
ncbi:MAG: diphthine--ammonia ligase [Candidatus Odinarchaeota archaeon]